MKKFLSALLCGLIMFESTAYGILSIVSDDGTPVNQNKIVYLSSQDEYYGGQSEARLIYISHDKIDDLIAALRAEQDNYNRKQKLLTDNRARGLAIGGGLILAAAEGAAAIALCCQTDKEYRSSKWSKKTLGLSAGTVVAGGGCGATTILSLALPIIANNMDAKVNHERSHRFGSTHCCTRWDTQVKSENITDIKWPRSLSFENANTPVDASSYWHNVPSPFRGIDSLIDALETISNNPLYRSKHGGRHTRATMICVNGYKTTKNLYDPLHSDMGKGIIIAIITHPETSPQIDIYKQGACNTYANDNRRQNQVYQGGLVLEGICYARADGATQILSTRPDGYKYVYLEHRPRLSDRKIVGEETFDNIDSNLVKKIFPTAT